MSKASYFEGPALDHDMNEFGEVKVWPDKSGTWPSKLDTAFVGKTYFHPGTGHLYDVLGIVFQSEDERWMLAYRRRKSSGVHIGPLFLHRPEDFSREGRFLEVKK